MLVAEGYFVAPRAPLVEIFDPTSLVVRFAVPERYSTRLSPGGRVEVILDAMPGHARQGKIVRIYPELDRSTRYRTVEAELDRAEGIAPGMFARLRVILKRIPEAVVVPIESLIVTPKNERVVFVIKSGRARRRPVTIGAQSGGAVQILKGVEPGEQVVVAGGEKLRDNTRVRVAQPKKPARAGANMRKDRGR